MTKSQSSQFSVDTNVQCRWKVVRFNNVGSFSLIFSILRVECHAKLGFQNLFQPSSLPILVATTHFFLLNLPFLIFHFPLSQLCVFLSIIFKSINLSPPQPFMVHPCLAISLCCGPIYLLVSLF